ncbi:hypothetical protein CFC21_004507 [Triticum aestivum]|uniref:FBD domain-containing protein n=1 Tax=Triticum aestivum TaxID=4565 RepID=A0A3B5Y7V0_WHEAT|nr:hypothetical protein CFC21_004507 [Triticum aestivum]
MTHLQQLSPHPLVVHGHNVFSQDHRDWSMLLNHFDHVSILNLGLYYMPVIGYGQFLMKEMTKFPNITILKLEVLACGHSFGASSFHLLRMSSGIRELKLKLLDMPRGLEGQIACRSGCRCVEPSNWETKELVLRCLEEIEIDGFIGTEHELALVRRLFKWTTMLKRMTVHFNDSVTQSKGKELCQLLLSFSTPEICMKFLH